MAADFNDGIQKGNLKLALGWSQENHEPYRAQLLQGQFEFFATDYFGVRGNAALPLSLAAPGMQYYPLTLGMALHFLPRHAVDFFAGADAGFVYFGTSQLRANWSTRITAIAGMSLYFWGAFFFGGGSRLQRIAVCQRYCRRPERTYLQSPYWVLPMTRQCCLWAILLLAFVSGCSSIPLQGERHRVTTAGCTSGVNIASTSTIGNVNIRTSFS
ncbi:MAG: hypothetical protein NZM25_10170 [Leptospiraceae bacterium]|nr:hypothetical protein [Leptospiraceae bacterium]